MHGSIVQIGGDARLDQIVHSIHLVFVGNQVLDGCNDAGALDSFDGQGSTERLKDRV